MASVTLKGMYKVYEGGVTAVSDFNLDIEDKEFSCGRAFRLRKINYPRWLQVWRKLPRANILATS